MRIRSILALLTVAALAACGGDSGTDPGDGNGNGNGNGTGDGTEGFVATLSADNVVGEDVVSGATGSATFELDSASGNLSYQIVVQNMDNVINAHIHAPATESENANILLTLYDAPPSGTINGTLVSGTIVPGSGQLTAGQTLAGVLTHMRSDRAHVMVHSSEYPNGEIRGHVNPAP